MDTTATELYDKFRLEFEDIYKDSIICNYSYALSQNEKKEPQNGTTKCSTQNEVKTNIVEKKIHLNTKLSSVLLCDKSDSSSCTTHANDSCNIVFLDKIATAQQLRSFYNTMMDFFCSERHSIQTLKTDQCLNTFILVVLVLCKQFEINLIRLKKTLPHDDKQLKSV